MRHVEQAPYNLSCWNPRCTIFSSPNLCCMRFSLLQSLDGGNTWQLVGLISLLDPPREDSADTIERAQELGVKVGFLISLCCFCQVETPSWLHITRQGYFQSRLIFIQATNPESKPSVSFRHYPPDKNSCAIKVKMVTGDQLAIGIETAKRLRMGKATFPLVHWQIGLMCS